MSDFGKRVDRLERDFGDDGDPDAAYRPQVLAILHTRYWRGATADGAESNEEEGAEEGAYAAAWPPPESAELRVEAERRRAATIAEIVAWVTAEARKHNHPGPYLVVTFPDADYEPERARFTLPWYPQGRRSALSQAVGSLTGEHHIEWPLAASQAAAPELTEAE